MEHLWKRSQHRFWVSSLMQRNPCSGNCEQIRILSGVQPGGGTEPPVIGSTANTAAPAEGAERQCRSAAAAAAAPRFPRGRALSASAVQKIGPFASPNPQPSASSGESQTAQRLRCGSARLRPATGRHVPPPRSRLSRARRWGRAGRRGRAEARAGRAAGSPEGG